MSIYDPSKFGSTVLTDQLLLYSGGCSLIRIFGYLSSVSGANNYGFIQLHDQIAALTGGEVPEVVIPVPVLGSYSFGFEDKPWIFANGVIAAVSATGPTFTLGSLGWFTGDLFTQ